MSNRWKMSSKILSTSCSHDLQGDKSGAEAVTVDIVVKSQHEAVSTARTVQ